MTSICLGLYRTCLHVRHLCVVRVVQWPPKYLQMNHMIIVLIFGVLCVALRTLGLKEMNPISISTESLLERIPHVYTNDKLFDFLASLHNIQPSKRPSALNCLEILENSLSNLNFGQHEFHKNEVIL